MTNKPHIHHTDHSILAAGDRIQQAVLRDAWEQPQIQQLLGAARKRFGNALCACRREPLKLQIRLRDGKYHLAVWPQEGPSHDSECLFFRDEVAEESAPTATARAATTLGEVKPAAAQALGPSRLALVLGGTAEPGSSDTLVSIRSLAHRLWDAASLCRWHPSWTRDWGRTRYQLQQAAAQFSINGQHAEKLLFVPRPYRESMQGMLNAEWDGFLRDLITNRDRLPRILIAPIRRVVPEREGHPPAVFLRHLHVPIGLTPACANFIWRDCRTVLSNSRLSTPRLKPAPGAAATPQYGPEVIGVFSVDGSSRGGVWARAGWLLPVHPTTYIPAGNHDTVMLIDSLLSGGYAFQHLMSELQPSRRTNADWLLRHVMGPDGRPVARAALEILDRGCTVEYAGVRAGIAQRMSAQGIPTWTWSPAGRPYERTVPPLPPSDQAPTEVAAESLRQISLSPHAQYRYGPGNQFTLHERKSA